MRPEHYGWLDGCILMSSKDTQVIDYYTEKLYSKVLNFFYVCFGLL